MARKIRTTFLFLLFLFVAFLVALYYHLFHDVLSGQDFLLSSTSKSLNHAINESLPYHSIPNEEPISTVSVLFPGWEVLVIVSPETLLGSDEQYVCVFYNNETSPAKPAPKLSSPDRTTFNCDFPSKARRRLPFRQPILLKSHGIPPVRFGPPPDLLRWNYIVYDSVNTEEDVVLFAKGVNKRQGVNRDPTEFNCMFGDDVNNAVRTPVTSSAQEVFRCHRPQKLALLLPSGSDVDDTEERVKVTLQIAERNWVVPTVAYYYPKRRIPSQKEKTLLCACTMVYNVAKFLREWVMYHSKIGVEKFILYDNWSDDELNQMIGELQEEGFQVEKFLWAWPKAQEAGFSHAALHANKSCQWMVYMDVDEFIYSPSWSDSTDPSKAMLNSLLPDDPSSSVGQIMIGCREFGPSNQMSHPPMGVIQGYNCRRRVENRHKSIVLLDAIDVFLFNSVHHFGLKEGYRSKKLRVEDTVVNHYKYQAWPEFKAKFRRRVSAYVVDWTQQTNLRSNDRTPGLGYEAVEPVEWPQKFCEVYDDGLKELAIRWFGAESKSGFHMAWQR